MVKYIKKRETISIIHSVICDVCGEDYISELEHQEFLHIDMLGGYASIFGDGTHIKCDICQHCLYKMIHKYIRNV